VVPHEETFPGALDKTSSVNDNDDDYSWFFNNSSFPFPMTMGVGRAQR
jgi:hypothetical protein